MPSENQVHFTGNVTREPDLRFTSSGQAVCEIGLAVNRRWKDRSDEWQEDTTFVDVTCWGQMAENVAESLDRGARIMVAGRLDQRSWENKEGEKRTKLSVTADEVGVALRWATATVVKNERRDQSVGGRAPRQEAQSMPYDPDERPF